MLQDYRRLTKIKSFAPILKDQCSKRWDCDVSIRTNLSLLSVSNSSASIDDDDKIDINEYKRKRDSLDSPASIVIPINEQSNEHDIKQHHIDPYILDKHLNGITSTRSNLVEEDIDKSIRNLFRDDKSSYNWQDDDYDPRSIRPPSFSEFIKKSQQILTSTTPMPRRIKNIPVRTTKAEQLRLSRQHLEKKDPSNLPRLRPFTSMQQSQLLSNSKVQDQVIKVANNISRSRANSNCSFKQSESTQSMRVALRSNEPLRVSAMLVKQMRQDIQSNRVPAFSKPLNSALLREQPNPPFTYQYKMQRVFDWLENSIPANNCVEFNEDASNETILGTNLNDKLDDEYGLLSDEKQKLNVERTYAEAHRVLPLFKSETHRKMRQHDLLLTRIELDLYVI